MIVRSAGSLLSGSLDGGIWNDELGGSPKGSNLIGIGYQIRPYISHDGIWSQSEAGIALGGISIVYV